MLSLIVGICLLAYLLSRRAGFKARQIGPADIALNRWLVERTEHKKKQGHRVVVLHLVRYSRDREPINIFFTEHHPSFNRACRLFPKDLVGFNVSKWKDIDQEEEDCILTLGDVDTTWRQAFRRQ